MTSLYTQEDTSEKGVLELQAIKLDLEQSPYSWEELKITEWKTADTLMSEPEIIDYDEALRRAGGFGAYQVLLFFAVSLFNIYGDQIIFNFVYLSSPYK